MVQYFFVKDSSAILKSTQLTIKYLMTNFLMIIIQVSGQEVTPSPSISTVCNGGLRERVSQG